MPKMKFPSGFMFRVTETFLSEQILVTRARQTWQTASFHALLCVRTTDMDSRHAGRHKNILYFCAQSGASIGEAVWNWSGKVWFTGALSLSHTFSLADFFRPFLLFLAPLTVPGSPRMINKRIPGIFFICIYSKISSSNLTFCSMYLPLIKPI